MCGRFTLNLDGDSIQRQFELTEAPDWSPRWNLAPGQRLPTLDLAASGSGLDCQLSWWGLLPSWAKKGMRPLINARAETAAEKPSFRNAFRKRRCLVPATGFFEWQKAGGDRIPFWFHRPDRSPFTIAALWEPSADQGCAFALLTTAASEDVAPVHHRMPVIIAPRDRARWLDPTKECTDLLTGQRQGFLASHPVTTAVNKVSFDGPQCLEPAPPNGLFEDHA